MFKIIIMVANGVAILIISIILVEDGHNLKPTGLMIAWCFIILAASNIFLLVRGQRSLSVLDYFRSLMELKTLKNQKEIENIKGKAEDNS